MSASSVVARSWGIFPAGSNGEFNIPREQSMLLVRGEGCRGWHCDNDVYLDFSMGWGPCFVGHVHSDIVAAVCAQAAQGPNSAHLTEAALRLAERVRAPFPAVGRLRFCASGTEAACIASGWGARTPGVG